MTCWGTVTVEVAKHTQGHGGVSRGTAFTYADGVIHCAFSALLIRRVMLYAFTYADGVIHCARLRHEKPSSRVSKVVHGFPPRRDTRSSQYGRGDMSSQYREVLDVRGQEPSVTKSVRVECRTQSEPSADQERQNLSNIITRMLMLCFLSRGNTGAPVTAFPQGPGLVKKGELSI